MGTVWLAYSGQAKGHCAVKVLHLRDDRKGSAERSFNREVRAMARLSHPAVIEILDYGRTPAMWRWINSASASSRSFSSSYSRCARSQASCRWRT